MCGSFALPLLKARVAEYEKLCFSLDQVLDHFSTAPESELIGRASTEGREEVMPARVEDGESEALLGLFVDVILRSKQVFRKNVCNAMCPL